MPKPTARAAPNRPAADTPGPRLLVIEDEQTIAYLLYAGLKDDGFDVRVAHDGHAGLKLASESGFDLVVLDLMLPGIDGMQLCRRLRESGNGTAIIMLTARTDVRERVAGLDCGADDYLTKPFSFDELLARIRAVLRRRGHPEPAPLLQAAGLSLNVETREVSRHGEAITLTRKEFALLETLMRHPRRVFTRENLMSRVWGPDHASDPAVVDVHMSHVRDKIGDGGRRLIQTVYGLGYSLRPEDGEALE